MSTQIDIQSIIHNFPNTVAYIKFLIETVKTTDLAHTPVIMQFELYQYYIEDAPDDFLVDLFYGITSEDKQEFFKILKYPLRYPKVEFRSYFIKYLFKNYQEFFNSIFQYIITEELAKEEVSPFAKHIHYARSIKNERLSKDGRSLKRD